ncbi:flagellar motor protein [Dehalobacter sp. DCM]|uniref:flagellar motor protein n=1 Tax=Dehalobacter sp. DCM TaxID=2907827 RepID=UPI003081EF41|nr:flagellar motor protein [Dehalobacter sp. DCM]
MDITTILGLVIGLFGILFGFILEGGHLGALVGIPPFLIVVLGTLGATVIGIPLKELRNLPKWLRIAFTDHAFGAEDAYFKLVHFSEKARQEGLLSLEQELDSIEDTFTRQGMQLVIDGTDAEITKNILESKINVMETRHRFGISFFESAGGYSPTLGIIGTVMGLIHVLGNLSNSDQLAGSIAAAFIATLYGVCFANLIYLPIATKLKLKSQMEVQKMEMILDGIISIQSGENPFILKEKLKTHLGYIPNASGYPEIMADTFE